MRIVYCCLLLDYPVVAWKCMKQTEGCLLASFGRLLKMYSYSAYGSQGQGRYLQMASIILTGDLLSMRFI